MGVRLRKLREQRGLTQAELADALRLSPSYLNQLENNQRPLTVPVLLRLQAAFDIDVQWFSEDEEARLTSELREVFAMYSDNEPIAASEIQALASQMPAVARAVLRLSRRCAAAEQRLTPLMAQGIDRVEAIDLASPIQPYAAVREFFYARQNHIADLDEHAEKLHTAWRLTDQAAIINGAPASLAQMTSGLVKRLTEAHSVRIVRTSPQTPLEQDVLREYDPETRVLRISARLSSRQYCFQLATQLAFLEAGDLIERHANDAEAQSDNAREMIKLGLGSYFAGALILPYGAFLQAAENLKYDIDLLSERFDVSLETVCHRLSTLQRPTARGVPFFFVRVDRVGNLSKSQSATDFHFSRIGGSCPLWTVYEAFSRPDRTLAQLARMPDGRTYLWIARCVTSRPAGYALPPKVFAIALGCDVRYADRLVYSKGLDLQDPNAPTPIGPGCRVCERKNCIQRALPAVSHPQNISSNLRYLVPYQPRDEY